MKPDQLDTNWLDHATTSVKLLGSLVPLIGGPLSVLIAETIPNQRLDRIVKYLRYIEERLANLEKKEIEGLLNDPERVDLVESGGYLAARSTSPDRLERIAEIVFRGLSKNDTNLIRRKRLLTLFGEIDDDQFLILNAYGKSLGRISSQVWETVDRPPPATLGSSQEQLENAALYEVGKQNLLRLGLLERKYDQVKKDSYPPFDPKSGGFKSRLEISHLGRMLLKEAGITLSF